MELPAEEPEPEEPIGWDGGGSYGGPHRVRRRAVEARAERERELEDDIRIYGDPYEEYREEMLRKKGENC